MAEQKGRAEGGWYASTSDPSERAQFKNRKERNMGTLYVLLYLLLYFCQKNYPCILGLFSLFLVLVYAIRM